MYSREKKLLFGSACAIYGTCVGALTIEGVIPLWVFGFGFALMVAIYYFPGPASFIAQLMRPYGFACLVLAMAYAIAVRIWRAQKQDEAKHHRL